MTKYGALFFNIYLKALMYIFDLKNRRQMINANSTQIPRNCQINPFFPREKDWIVGHIQEIVSYHSTWVDVWQADYVALYSNVIHPSNVDWYTPNLMILYVLLFIPAIIIIVTYKPTAGPNCQATRNKDPLANIWNAAFLVLGFDLEDPGSKTLLNHEPSWFSLSLSLKKA